MNQATRRVKKDLDEFYRQRNDLIYLFPCEQDLLRGWVLMVGPEGTPYEKGLFLFEYKCPSTYPINPPKVTFLTNGRSTKVRFNPNLYDTGLVCLSILGTFSGPPWTAIHTLESVFVSIQSLLNEHPYGNEPGWEQAKYGQASADYNERIAYYTILHAVIEQADLASGFPTGQIRDMVTHLFFKYEDFYRTRIASKMADSEAHKRLARKDPYESFSNESMDRTTFSYADLKTKFDAVAGKLSEKYLQRVVPTLEYDRNLSMELLHIGEPSKPKQEDSSDEGLFDSDVEEELIYEE